MELVLCSAEMIANATFKRQWEPRGMVVGVSRAEQPDCQRGLRIPGWERNRDETWTLDSPGHSRSHEGQRTRAQQAPCDGDLPCLPGSRI